MNDEKLLTLAAKAMRLEYDHLSGSTTQNGIHYTQWSPLTDDGDSMRLAVSLRLCISYEDDGQVIDVWNENTCENSTEEFYDSDPYAATRRAIVRAAAQIGKGMK